MMAAGAPSRTPPLSQQHSVVRAGAYGDLTQQPPAPVQYLQYQPASPQASPPASPPQYQLPSPVAYQPQQQAYLPSTAYAASAAAFPSAAFPSAAFPSSGTVYPQTSGGSYQQQQPQTTAPVLESVMDLHNLPRMTPEALNEMLRQHNVVIGADGALMKKHIYRVKRHRGGCCGCWNRGCGGCYDKGRCCDGCNCDGCCDRKRITYRRDSAGSDASLWSSATAIKPSRAAHRGAC